MTWANDRIFRGSECYLLGRRKVGKSLYLSLQSLKPLSVVHTVVPWFVLKLSSNLVFTVTLQVFKENKLNRSTSIYQFCFLKFEWFGNRSPILVVFVDDPLEDTAVDYVIIVLFEMLILLISPSYKLSCLLKLLVSFVRWIKKSPSVKKVFYWIFWEIEENA